MRVLLIGTYRDIEVSRRHPLSRALAELTRQGLSRRLTLRGLSREDVASFVGRMVRRAPVTPALIEAVHRQTEGNPLFVTEVVRLLSQEGAWAEGDISTMRGNMRIPEGVCEVIGRRLDRLSEQCNECLTTAAVIGRQFTLEQLNRLMDGMTQAQVLDAIEQALAARVIEEIPATANHFQFTHALIGETLVEELSTSRRIRLHERIGAALEDLFGEEAAAHAPELAHHFTEAVGAIGSDKSIHYSLLAGEQALAAYAHEQALAHFDRGLATLEGKPLDARSAALLVGRARAQMIGLERHRFPALVETLQRAFEYFVSTGEIARAIDIADLGFPHFLGVEGVMAPVIDRALQLVAPDSVQAGRLLTRKGRILGINEGNYDGAQAVLDDALRIARNARDLALERRALVAQSYVAFYNLRHRLGVQTAQRALDLAVQAKATDDEVAARYFLASCLRHLAETDRFREQSVALGATAAKLRNRWWLASAFWMNETASRIRGDWAEARNLIDQGLGVSPNDIRLLSSRPILEYETGEEAAGDIFLERLVSIVRTTPRGATPEYAMSCGVLAMAGDITGATVRYTTADEFARIVLSAPTPSSGTACVARIALALKAMHFQDVAAATEHYDALMAWRHPLCLPVSHCFDRLLGRLAGFVGRSDDARQHFDSALALCRRIEHRSELAWSLFDYGVFLSESKPRSDRAKAESMFGESLEIATALDMRPLVERVRRR